jgi:hypothetical protein
MATAVRSFGETSHRLTNANFLATIRAYLMGVAVPPIYINDFDQPTYQYKLLRPGRIEKLLTGFEPAYSPWIFLYTGTGPIHGLIEEFGSMLPGTTPPPNAPAVGIIVVEQLAAKLCIGPMLGTLINPGTGAAVTMDASAASSAQDQSQGFFLLPGFKIAAIDASVTFDTPIATTTDKWSVGLILKSGDQTDQPSDNRVGLTCQFKAGGVYIGALAAVPAIPATQADSGKTFGDYNNSCTQFTLHYAIKPNAQGKLTATGSLQVGAAAPVSPAPSFDIDLPNLNFVTAIGTSITTGTSIPQIGATFRQFMINSVTLVR